MAAVASCVDMYVCVCVCVCVRARAQACKGASGMYLLGHVCKRLNLHEEAAKWLALALQRDPLLWCAYEDLCAIGVARAHKHTNTHTITYILAREHTVTYTPTREKCPHVRAEGCPG
jgi:hypothetical protein